MEVAFCNWNMTEMRYDHLMHIIEWYVWFLVYNIFGFRHLCYLQKQVNIT